MARQIVVQIVGDESGFTKATQRASSAGANLEKDLKHLAVIGVEALAAITVAAGAFAVAAVEKTVAAGQAAFEMSQKFGMLPGIASQWSSVAAQLGIDSETIGTGFKFLAKNVEAMNLTLESGKKVAPATLQVYKDLGLNVFTAGGQIKDANELMMETADVFAAMPDGIAKAGLAVKIFGRSGQDMLPVLDLGRAGIQKLIDSGVQMGAVMTGPQVEAAHKLALAQDRIKVAMDGVTVQVAEFLMPAVERLINFITSQGIPAVQRLGQWFSDHLWPALQQVWAGAKMLWDAFAHFLAPAIDYIRAHSEALKPYLVAVGVVAAIALGLIVLGAALVVGAVVGLVVAMTWVSDSLGKLFNWIGQNWVGLENTIIGGVRNVIGALNRLPGVHIALPAIIQTPGTSTGQTTAAHFGAQSFASGGVVQGSGPQLAIVHGGETVLPAGRSSAGNITININNPIGGDGPYWDNVANKIAQRLAYATGR